MLIAGLLLIALAAAAIVAAVFATDADQLSYLGFDVAPLALFLIGAGTVVVLLAGTWLARFGAKRGLRMRRETRRLAKLGRERERADQERARADKERDAADEQ